MAKLADEVIEVLLHFRNAVLEGAPGTGKTFAVDAIAKEWEGRTGRILHSVPGGTMAMTFHPNTTYETFIGGVQFDASTKTFSPVKGFLLRAADLARENPDEDLLIVLDELNRANVPKVLGDALLCMEASKRTRHDGTAWVGGMSVILPSWGERFSLPNNLYILGTMNTTDRSIAPLDTALRRRFGFVRAEPLSTSQAAAAIDEVAGVGQALTIQKSIDQLAALNEVLRSSLGPDAVLGHSYLFSMVGQNAQSVSSPQAGLSDFLEAYPVRNKAFWLETRPARNGYAANQFNVPETSVGGRVLLDMFYPLTTETGTQTAPSKTRPDHFAVEFQGNVWKGNELAYNAEGNNWKLQLRGTSGATKLASLTTPGILLDKYLVWAADEDNMLHMLVLDHSQANRDALLSASDWSDSTRGSSGREFGVLTQPKPHPEVRTTERLVWRYAILPQLIDLVTQLGDMDVFAGDRDVAAGSTGVSERLKEFHNFLAQLGLKLSIQGDGVGEAMVIEDIPVVEEELESTTDDALSVDIFDSDAVDATDASEVHQDDTQVTSA